MATRDITEEEMLAAQDFGWSARAAGAEHLSVRPIGGGRAVYLRDLLFGNLQVGIGRLGAEGLDDVWEYQECQTAAAWRAALGWDGEGEPDGWYRHPFTGRRRPCGDASKQVVNW